MDITDFAGKRTALMNALLDKLGYQVEINQILLLRAVIDDFLDNLDTKAGVILNSARNKRLLTLFDGVFDKYNKVASVEVIKTIIDGVQSIVNFNSGYFEALTPNTKLAPVKTSVESTIKAWLGYTDDGKITPNGYLETLVNDTTVKNQIRNLMVKNIVNQTGYNAAKLDLKNYITGSKQAQASAGEGVSVPDTGALSKYYRNFVYDTYSQIDRSNANMYADELELKYAIYEGGIIKTTRPFCKKRNGKVFTREEITAFGDAEPPPAKPPGYNPFTDLGGYGCRHHLNWITEAIAFALRPELRAA